MTFGQYLDFSGILADEDLTEVWGKALYPKRNHKPNYEYHVDGEIKRISADVDAKYPKLVIDAARQAAWVPLKNTFVASVPETDERSVFSVLEAKFYRSKTKDFYLIFLSVERDGPEDAQILGLIHKPSETFLFLGCSGQHPFISTREFRFSNSDGSGPDILEAVGATPTPCVLLVLMSNTGPSSPPTRTTEAFSSPREEAKRARRPTDGKAGGLVRMVWVPPTAPSQGPRPVLLAQPLRLVSRTRPVGRNADAVRLLWGLERLHRPLAPRPRGPKRHLPALQKGRA